MMSIDCTLFLKDQVGRFLSAMAIAILSSCMDSSKSFQKVRVCPTSCRSEVQLHCKPVEIYRFGGVVIGIFISRLSGQFYRSIQVGDHVISQVFVAKKILKGGGDLWPF